MKLDFDVIIIGSGPAGMSAALYLRRSNINTLMIEANAPGGQINKTDKIENYIGFMSIDGPTLAHNMFTQVQSLGIVYKYGEVTDIIDKIDYKMVKTKKETFICKAVIIATGRKPKELGLDNEKTLIGRGISWCAVCDGPLFKGKDVIVVGGGNSALEESLYLTNFVNKVILIHRRHDFRGDKTLQERVINNPKIEIYYDTIITKINEQDNYFSGVEVENSMMNEKKTIDAKGLFIYIGSEPASEIYQPLNLKLNNGYIIVDTNMRTSIKYIYACGDIIDKELYQITTSVGEGAIAAMSAIKDISDSN